MPYLERPTRGRYGRKDHDQKCPDGFTCAGWRRICQGGYVRFSGGKHYHAEFEKYVGQWVYVTLDDPWGLNVDAFMEGAWVGYALPCTNEKSWFADDPVEAARESRERPKRVCN